MAIGVRRLALLTVLLLVIAGITGRAYGFFPRGGFNLNQQLRYATWSFKEFDTDADGVIEQGEGLEFRIEGGPQGFSPDEIEQVKAGFKVWENVPTSYVAFRYAGVIEDPIIPGLGSPDYLPQVFMQVTNVAEDDGYSQPDDLGYFVPEITGGLVGIALSLYTIDITAIPVGDNTVIVPAGTILDCDVIMNASYFRYGVVEDNTLGVLDLQASITKVAGYLLGLADSPLNNLDPYNTVAGLLTEPAIMQVTGTDGIARMVGATPTMFLEYFLTQSADGEYTAGWADLAPDDISGVSWLYPREDGLENFFSVQHTAQTQVRNATGIPPAPISGAHVVAWADVTNSPSGRRVPMFSTMTGLYNVYTDTQLSGRFNLMGLWKQLEAPGEDGVLFEPSYVMTMTALNGLGYDRQAPPDMTASMFDSMQGSSPISYSTIVRPATEFSDNYPSEVFNEDGNIYGVDNYAAGTPLVWSYENNMVVSANSGKSLARMLPHNMPMFGDPDTVCPMNIIENSDGITSVVDIASINNKLRGFRDNTLLGSAIGTALVDFYYKAAPFVSSQMLKHESVMNFVQTFVVAAVWVWERLMTIMILLITAGIVAAFAARRRQLSPAGVAAAVIALFFCVAVVSHAAQIPLTTEQLVEQSTYIVSGKVVSAEGTLGSDGRIYTNVVFEVSDVAKGDLNRGSVITFTIIGGQYGSLALSATGIPGFKTDEHAVLHLKDIPDYGLVPCGGLRSKVPIYVDEETGEEDVITGDTEGEVEQEGEVEEEGEATEEGESVEGESVDEGEDVEEGETVEEGESAEEGETVEGEAEEEGEEETSETKSIRTLPAKAAWEARAGRVSVRTYMRRLRAIANSQR